MVRKPRDAAGRGEWWAHQDLNLGPSDYEFARNAASPAKSGVIYRKPEKLKVFTGQ